MPEPATGPRTWDQIRADVIKALRSQIPLLWSDSTMGEIADAVLAVFDEEALNRLGQHYVEQSRLRSLRAEDKHAVLEMVPAKDAIAGWCLAARGMLDGHGAENYTETRIEFPDRPRGERYAFILQRVGKLTPHEARKRAEAETERLRARIEALAAEWEAKAREIGSQIEYADTEGAVAGFKMIGYQNHKAHAEALRALLEGGTDA